MKNKGGCLGCKHFSIEESIHYSEHTWEDGRLECLKGHWYGQSSGEDAYQDIIVRGSTCPDYDKADYVDEGQ